MTTKEAIFAFIKISTKGEADKSLDFSGTDWDKLLMVASQQGAKGAVWDGIWIQAQSGRLTLTVPEKMKWHGTIKKSQGEMGKTWEICADFAKNLLPYRCIVLKGPDYSRYWPNPLDREYSDLDCWCMGDFDQSNKKAIEIGGEVEEAGYKHNHIRYKGLTIENHRYFTEFCDTEQGIKTEKLLKELASKETKNIGETNLLSPNANFTALFMLRHAQLHFLAEGISMKHILDWLYFLRREEKNIDWKLVYEAMDMMNMRAFADIMTICCDNKFGWKASEYHIKNDFKESDIDTFVEDLFEEKPSTADLRLWKKAQRIMRRFKRMWKFRALLEESYAKKVWLTFTYNTFTNRHPDID